MPRPSAAGGRSRQVIAATVALLVPALAGCTASYGAQTSEPYLPALGESAETGSDSELKLRNVLAVAEENGRATLVGTIVNRGSADVLSGVDVANGSAEVTSGGSSVPPGVTQIGWGEEEADVITVVLDGPDIEPGHTVPVTIRFGTAAPVSLRAQVVRNTDAFADVPIPEPSSAPAHTPDEDDEDSDN